MNYLPNTITITRVIGALYFIEPYPLFDCIYLLWGE